MIDKKLIEKSLALCGREYSDMKIEDYCYFLLSPEFIEKYSDICDTVNIPFIPSDFGNAIWQYQSGNEESLIELLSKIGN